MLQFRFDDQKVSSRNVNFHCYIFMNGFDDMLGMFFIVAVVVLLKLVWNFVLILINGLLLNVLLLFLCPLRSMETRIYNL